MRAETAVRDVTKASPDRATEGESGAARLGPGRKRRRSGGRWRRIARADRRIDVKLEERAVPELLERSDLSRLDDAVLAGSDLELDLHPFAERIVRPVHVDG
jgi:hypothetical protein